MVLDRNYLDLKNQVIKAERKLLNALGFVVHVRHPHKLIYAYLLALGALDNHELMQKAWSYMNDGLRADIFLRYRPETIACACIYLAARTISKPVALPQQPFPWFEAFDASDRDVKAISLILLKLYTRARAPNWLRLNETLNKIRFGPDSVFAKIRAAESQAQADREMERAKAALEKKKREVARKVLEMQRGVIATGNAYVRMAVGRPLLLPGHARDLRWNQESSVHRRLLIAAAEQALWVEIAEEHIRNTDVIGHGGRKRRRDEREMNDALKRIVVVAAAGKRGAKLLRGTASQINENARKTFIWLWVRGDKRAKVRSHSPSTNDSRRSSMICTYLILHKCLQMRSSALHLLKHFKSTVRKLGGVLRQN
uniref:Cyclin-L2 n=1 Tax=Ascaris suum TaxID=6253 RepID=F1KUF4_ASCSU